MIVEAIASFMVGLTFGYVVYHTWVTRRQPVRKDAPTHGTWTQPDDFWRD
jgi:hypothetical protein